MGSFAHYKGCDVIPDDKKTLFVEQMCRLLNLGGMMGIDEVKMFGRTINLLLPVQKTGEKVINFHFNYFEDDEWEPAGFDTEKVHLWSNKIGDDEFSDVMVAAYMLYELYDTECVTAKKDGEFVNALTIGWINHVLGTRYTVGKRANIWDCVERDMLDRDCNRLKQSNITELIPSDWRESAGGTDLADILYIIHGTDSLTEENVEEDSYPFDVLKCRCALEEYFRSKQENSMEFLWELLKQSYEIRAKEQDGAFTTIAPLTLYMPARVFVYLAAEIKDVQFWELWQELYQDVYHDEQSKPYASKALEEWRRDEWKKPVAPIRTEKYLRQQGYFAFYKTPDELTGKPDYYLSDADRLYWWDGTDEVRISDETEEWLKKMAERHKEIMSTFEVSKDFILNTKEFFRVLDEINKYYWRIIPFESMFYDFIENIYRREYVAAIELLRQVADEKENRESGEIIQYRKNGRTYSKNVTGNEGRLQMKRIYAVFANKRLREKYFGF